MISRTVRHAAMLVWWMAVLTVTLLANVWAVCEHYLSAKNALEKVGTEQQELWRDGLLGQFLGAFIPSATLPQAIALTIALIEAIALLIVIDEVLGAVRLVKLRIDAKRRDDHEEVREATHRIAEAALVVAMFGTALWWAVRFDMSLFQFRALAGAAGAESAEDAARLMNWPDVVAHGGQSFAVALAGVGALGYVAFTVLGCLALDRVFSKVSDRFTLLINPLDLWLERVMSGQPDETLLYGYDEQGQPVYDPAAQIAYDTNGNLLVATATAGEASVESTDRIAPEPTVQSPAPTVDDGSAPRASCSTAVAADARSEEQAQVIEPTPTSVASTASCGQGELFAPPTDPTRMSPPPAEGAANVHGPARTRPAKAATDGDARPVVGGVPDERVSLTQALQDQERYHVETTTQRIWTRALWDALHGSTTDAKAA